MLYDTPENAQQFTPKGQIRSCAREQKKKKTEQNVQHHKCRLPKSLHYPHQHIHHLSTVSERRRISHLIVRKCTQLDERAQTTCSLIFNRSTATPTVCVHVACRFALRFLLFRSSVQPGHTITEESRAFSLFMLLFTVKEYIYPFGLILFFVLFCIG